MNIKNATKIGMIGAVLATISYLICFLVSVDVISLNYYDDWDKHMLVNKIFAVSNNLIQLLSGLSFATFFYVLFKNQK